jgi:AcrR family transcriptional regulator
MASQGQHQSKTKLLDAALNAIRAKGYSATTVDEIWHSAGVTKGSFFHHFRTKDDLALAAAAHWSQMTEGFFAGAPYRRLADGDEVLACEGTGILPVIPKTQTSGNVKRGLFTVADFIYDTENDRYTCPAGEHLTKGKVRSDRRDDIDHYRNLTACLTCALKPRCTPDKVKRLKRWEHESVLDKMQARLDHMPEAMTIRRQTGEHPFGTLKAWMGSTHFLTRTLEKVKTEMSLQVLAYNMTRMINIFGVNPLMQAIAA